MLKKSIICALAIIILSLCCTISFANDKGKNINLGNEIMRSIDKTENSMKNVVSGNVVKDTGNMVNEEINMIKDGANTIKNGTGNVENTMKNDTDNMENNMVVTGINDGNYNTARTSVDQTINGGVNTMTATTWMWIILITAAVTIMAAIWYYATQGNK